MMGGVLLGGAEVSEEAFIDPSGVPVLIRILPLTKFPDGAYALVAAR